LGHLATSGVFGLKQKGDREREIERGFQPFLKNATITSKTNAKA
jgi:hypothetical protein